MSVLEIKDLVKSFGGMRAVDGVSLEIGLGQILGLVGPNGSGKSTLINCVSGVCPPSEGRVRVQGHNITGMAADRIARQGVARTFQSLNVFPDLTCLANIVLAQAHQNESAFFAGIRKFPPANVDQAWQCLADVHLLEFADRPVGILSYGQQRLIEYAMARMRRPALLLLDEPTAGVNPRLVEILMQQIKDTTNDGTSILLVEHNMRVVSGLCESVVVMDKGQVIFRGSVPDMTANEGVIDAYFGR